MTIGGPAGQVVPYAVNAPNYAASASGLSNIFNGPVLLGSNITATNAASVASFATLNATTLNAANFTVSSLGITGNLTASNPNAIARIEGILDPQYIQTNIQINPSAQAQLTIGGLAGQIVPYAINTPNIAATNSALTNVFNGPVRLGGNISTVSAGSLATFGQLTANNISTTNLSVSGSVNGALTINGFTTMSNAQAFGITANTLTASNTIQGDVITGRVIQATQNLTAPLMTLQNLNVQQVAGISTGIVSSLFTNFINNQPYPPTTGVTGDTPSTMYASTVFIDGGLTVRGLGQNYITAANISSLSSVNVTGLLNASTVLFNGGMTNTGGLPIITSNLSAINIDNVAFINGQIYPPPSGSTSIPSTLYASTVLVNGSFTKTGKSGMSFIDPILNRTNGSIYATSATMQIAIPEVGSPGGSAFTITAGSTLASTLMFLSPTGRIRFTSSMTVRDPVPVGSPSQAYITTYVPGSEAPAGSVITANVSTPSINTSSIIFSGSGSKIVGDSSALGAGLNILSDDFQIANTAGDKLYLNMGQGVSAPYQGSTFWQFGQFNNPSTAYITAGNLWTYAIDLPGNPPAGQIITSTISTVSAVASTINTKYITASTVVGSNAFFENTSTNTLWAGNASTNTLSAGSISTTSLWASNVSSVNINISTINNMPYPLDNAVSGNLQLNPTQYVGSLRIQPGAITYLTLGLSVGSSFAFGGALTRYGQASVGSAQVTAPVILSASTLTSTASLLWGFTHTSSVGSLPATQAQAIFFNDGSFSTPKVVTTLGAIGLPNQELLGIFQGTGIGYLCIQNLTSTIVTVEGAGQYLPATTAPYGI